MFWSFIWKVAHPVSDRTQSCLTSVKLMELAGPPGHSPLKVPERGQPSLIKRHIEEEGLRVAYTRGF